MESERATHQSSEGSHYLHRERQTRISGVLDEITLSHIRWMNCRACQAWYIGTMAVISAIVLGSIVSEEDGSAITLPLIRSNI